GITTVEIMPVHAFAGERGWGYDGVLSYAPHRAYGDPDDLKALVDAAHGHGLNVMLDVVYNHTCEGNELGPTLSFKGIDNFSYYRTMPDQHRYYINDTGTGNTVNTSHPRVLQLILDSLRYWTEVMHVDGFRFDLGSILGREPTGFDPRGGFFDAIGQDPVLSRVKLIGEPWDIGPGGYQVGGFPPGWAEWNDKYRDTVREYWAGSEGMMQDFAARITGSGDIYDQRGRRPWAGVNFITAHDGFTLTDLVSYNDKHNEANGENNRDGHNHNITFNYGAEGPTDDVGIKTVRARQKRNFLATLLLSHGAPMILAGDEFGRTQGGNNNGYAQDNEISWLDWDGIDDEGEQLREFVRRLIKLRLSQPLLRRDSWRDGMIVTWLNPEGTEQTPEQWADPTATATARRLGRSDLDGTAEWNDIIIAFNARDDVAAFVLPERGREWRAVIQTDAPHGARLATPGGADAP
ncbi:glycogen debranching protein GlgX, partial [Mycobacterium tuberculosis]|nr:glycogen debranching protein GlgX [Mycobacterium tuberculosis]